jgi:hypothetical protein
MKEKYQRRIFWFAITTGILFCSDQAMAQLPAGYKGIPYRDSVYTGNKLNSYGAQNLPGRVELAYYDQGGEGVAYHDSSPENERAIWNGMPGEQRPGISGYIAFFRKNEGVDISYTKDTLDFTAANKAAPGANQLYIGWMAQGDWANYTIYVHQKRKYLINTMYSSTDNSPAELWVNNTFATQLIFPEKTGSLHRWTQSGVGEISFPEAGIHLVTVKFSTGMNFGYLDFLYSEARQKLQ